MLISYEEAKKYPDNTKFIEVNKNKINGIIKEIEVTLGLVPLKNGGIYPMFFGIWCDWKEDEWENLGYRLVEA